jgi:lipopolysaccharide/colanic/teichoic acid biosynthesis glycosyltransferase
MIRRLIDVGFAVITLALLCPLFLLITLAVRLDSPGNPFYVAWRAGRGGRGFRMFKFRTMFVGSGRTSPITARADRRITRVGRYLRRAKLDELPQFINLLLGDMTLVGPRPEDLAITRKYSTEQAAIFLVKPGITGCTQIDSEYAEDGIPDLANAEEFYVQQIMQRKLSRDLSYNINRTPWSDARIVLTTAAMVMRSVLILATTTQDAPGQVSRRAPHA